MFIESSVTSTIGSVRRSERRLDFCHSRISPLLRTEPEGGVALRSIDISPLNGVKRVLHDPACLYGLVPNLAQNKQEVRLLRGGRRG